MRKSRFLWIRDIPPKCRDTDLRNVFERHGPVQKIRMFKEGHVRHAVVAFTDIKSASAAINTETKLNDTTLKLEYCVSSDLPGIINHKPCNNSDSHPLPTNSVSKSEKDSVMKNVSSKNLNDSHHHHHQQQQNSLPNTTSNINNNNGQQQLGRGPLIFKRTNSSNLSSTHLLNQVLRTVQSSTLNSRVPSNAGLRGLKITDLPSSAELSDTTLRKNLFSEFRRCGHIQSVVLPSMNGTNGGKNSGRLAIITFRRPEEAECAYQAIQRGGKALFSTNISVELHPGIDINDDISTAKRSSASTDVPPSATAVRPAASLQSLSNQLTSNLPNKNLNSNSVDPATYRPTLVNKSPTRTLHVAGLTVEPTGPVTAEQLSTAFRKFGDIVNVQLRPSSNSALIQFSEVRGPIRAMSVHARDPLRLGGRPLTLAYTPSPPASALWISDLPQSLANMKDEELLHSLSQIVPVQEIVLINRTDPVARNQSITTASATLNSPHYAAYIRLNSENHATRLLSELRSGKYLGTSTELPDRSSTQTTAAPRRRLVAVDFASLKQSSFVTSLQMNASKSTLNSQRIRIISASSVDQWKHMTSQPPIASSAATTLTSISPSLDQSCRASTGDNSDRYSDLTSKSTHSTMNRSKSNNSASLMNSSSSLVPGFRENESKTEHGNNNGSNSNKDHSKVSKSAHRKSGRQKIHSAAASADPFSHQYLSNHDKRMRDSSPSSLSVSSVSSSGSSVSSDSSTSSSVSSGTISSSSSMSSLSSSSASSHLSPSRKIKNSSNQKSQSKSGELKREQANSVDVFKLGPSSNNVKKSSRKPSSNLEKTDSFRKHEPNSNSTLKPSKAHLMDESHSVWSHDSPGDSPSIQQPLRVVTTIAPIVYSPNRNLLTSSGELSSPGSSSSAMVTELSNVVKTPNGSDSVLLECPKSISLSTGKLISKVQQSTTTADGFRVSPTSRSCSVSASSGVSSGGPSFGSANSSGGGSAGSSPFNGGANSTASHGQLLSVTKSSNISSREQTKSVICSPSLNKQQPLQQLSRTQKNRPSPIESPSHLKLHLSSAQALASSSPGCNVPVYTTSTTPLTVSIRLTSAGRQSQSNPTASPCSMSAANEMFGSTQEKQNSDSLPLTPVSAPPMGCQLPRRSRSSSKESRRRSIGIEAPVSRTDSQPNDWWSHGTPVYESMYDKIKRRTNKEAEERRQRQLEALAAREKKRRKQKKKDQITKSPSASSAPFTPPDSFGSEHSGKTAATYSSGKSRHSTTVRPKTDQSPTKREMNRSLSSGGKTEIASPGLIDPNHANRWSSIQRLSDRTWSNRLDKESTDLTQHSRRTSDSLHSKSKRRRSAVSSLSSSLSSEGEFNSNSPPGTFTRLSLGMRFAVSATYHECIRPSKSTPNRKWSNASDAEDDDALSQLSSSLSCSSNENKLDKHLPSSRSHVTKSIRPAPTAKIGTCKPPIRSSLDSPNNLSRTSNHSNRKRHSDLSNSYEFSNSDHSWTGGEHRHAEPNKTASCLDTYNKMYVSKKSRSHGEVKVSKTVKSSTKTMDQHSPSKIELGIKRQQQEQIFPSRTSINGQPTKKRRLLKSDDLSKSPGSHGHHSPSKSGFHHQQQQRFHSPKPYFSDDGTLLDSETEDVKDSFLTSDSISHSSGRHSLKNYMNSTHHQSPTRSETGESNLSDLDQHPHTSLKLRTGVIGSRNPLCSLPSTCDDGDSVFEAFVDSDRFSANSKSTVSTEPMEQCDLNDHSPCLKSSDDEWHSGVASSSPHPAHLEFDDDDDDYGDGDTKPNQHAVMSYQSNNSLLVRMTSPICKLPSPTPDYSDDDDCSAIPVTVTALEESPLKFTHSIKKSPEQPRIASPPPMAKQVSDPPSHADGVKSQFPALVTSVDSTTPLDVICETKPLFSQSPIQLKEDDHIKTESISPVPVNIADDSKQQLGSIPTPHIVSVATATLVLTPLSQIDPATCKTQLPVAATSTSNLEVKTPTVTKPMEIPGVDTTADEVTNLQHQPPEPTVSSPDRPVVIGSHSFSAIATTITNITTNLTPKIQDVDVSELPARLSPVSSASAVSCSPKCESPVLSLNQLSCTTSHPSVSHIPPTYVHSHAAPSASLAHMINQNFEIKSKLIECNTFDKCANPTINLVTSRPTVASAPRSIGLTPSGSSNCVNPIAGGSLTEAHDITRYVQSVIERVKAERVEETQMAAAHCHQHSGHHSSVSSVPNSSACQPSHPSQFGKMNSEMSSIPPGGKRTSNNQRRSLLVTTSTCSSTKGSATRSSKWLNSLSNTSHPTSVVTCSSEWTDPVIQYTTPLTTSSISTLATTQTTASSGITMPSIPGVNACAPLISPLPQLATTHRVTRQSSSSNLNSRRTDALPVGDTPSVPSATNASNRRSRRSESKCTLPAISTKDNTTTSLPAPIITSTPVTTTATVPSAASSVVTPTTTSNMIQATRRLSGSTEEVIPPAQIASPATRCDSPVKTCPISIDVPCKSRPKGNRTAVDPYEPNFDEESPPGFDPGQLHHHRSTPPICPSPGLQQARKTPTVTPATACIGDVPPSSPPPVSIMTTTANTVAVTASVNVSATDLSCPQPAPVTSTPICAPSLVPSTITTSVCSVNPTVSENRSVDTVDEVIRDVCAGQFDVQSYLNNMRANTIVPAVVPANVSTKPAVTTSTDPILTQVAVPATTVSLPTTLAKPTTIVTNPPTLPFPLPISSEQMVAAVTIPVNSGSSVTKLGPLGKNGSNNVVNIGTGNALLNTLVAALQLIPGSQVTVTGPAAAAGVVGGIAGAGAGTISATTITLPVGAARQAAENIKAAVLSAKNASAVANMNINAPNAVIAQQTVHSVADIRKSSDPTPLTKSLGQADSDPKTMRTNSTVTAPVPSATSVQNTAIPSAPIRTTLPNPPNSSLLNVPTVSVQTSTYQSHAPNDLITLPAQVQPKTLSSIPNEHQIAATVSIPSSSLYQLQKVAMEAPLNRPVASLTSTPSSFDHASVGGHAANASTKFLTPSSSPHVQAPYIPPTVQPQMLCNMKQPFGSHHSPMLSSSPQQHSQPQQPVRTVPSTMQSPIPPVVPGRSPPLTTQNLIDRIANSVEPSVAMAFAQAAMSGSSLSRVLNENTSALGNDAQVLAYFRRLAQFLDTRGCNGSNKLSVSPACPQPPLASTDSQCHSGIYISSLSPSPTPSGPLSTSPHRSSGPLGVVPFAASPMTINTSDSETDINMGTGALISPPIGTPRQSVIEQNASLNGLGATQTWNNVGAAYPLVWQGRLSLKNIETRVALHYVHGNANLLHACMTLLASGGGGQSQFSLVTNGGPLRIVQRMRLEPAQLEGVQRKINQEGASCACLALPAGNNPVELLQQTHILNDNFIRYMQEKMAAGIINVGHPDYQQGLYVVHIFPPCEFSHAQLNLAAPDLHRRVVQSNQSHLLVVITTV